MSENKDIKTALPKLRFPEFVNHEEWIQMQLSTVSNVNMGQSPSSDSYNSVCEGLPLVQGNADIVDRRTKPARYTNSPKKIAHKGDLIMTVRAPVGTISIAETDVCIGRGVCSISAKSNTSQIFIYQYLINLENKWDNIAQGGIFASINGEDVKKLQVFFPTNYQEQTKIAECLSSLDYAISGVSDKIEALKEYKKGLMQQLFPSEGKTTPAFRFLRSEDWTVKPLANICDNLDNKRVPITSGQRKFGSIPYYGASGIIDYVDGYIYNEELLCISEDGANLVDRNYPIAFTINGKTWVNNHAHVLRFENKNMQILVEKYINSINVEDFLTGMAQPKLNRKKLDSIPIPLPKDPREQQKIAECLVSIENIIVSETQYLEQLKEHKKGLMQLLFPNLNE